MDSNKLIAFSTPFFILHCRHEFSNFYALSIKSSNISYLLRCLFPMFNLWYFFLIPYGSSVTYILPDLQQNYYQHNKIRKEINDKKRCRFLEIKLRLCLVVIFAT